MLSDVRKRYEKDQGSWIVDGVDTVTRGDGVEGVACRHCGGAIATKGCPSRYTSSVTESGFNIESCVMVSMHMSMVCVCSVCEYLYVQCNAYLLPRENLPVVRVD